MEIFWWQSKTGFRPVVLVSRDRKWNRIIQMESTPRIQTISKEDKLTPIPEDRKNNAKRVLKKCKEKWCLAGKPKIAKATKDILMKGLISND